MVITIPCLELSGLILLREYISLPKENNRLEDHSFYIRKEHLKAIQYGNGELENGEKHDYTVFPSHEDNLGSIFHYDNPLKWLCYLSQLYFVLLMCLPWHM